MSSFFQNTQNHGFWNFDFWFLSRGKKAAVNYFLYECKHIIMKNERISLSPTQYCALLVNLFVTLRQSDSSVEEKMVNYWPEICKLLPRDRKNVVLYTVTI